MDTTTEPGPASYEKLALELINKPEEFLRQCLPSLMGDKITDLGLSLACEKYIADHGYTALDFVRAVDILQGYTLADVDLFEDVDENNNVTIPQLSQVSNFSLKPNPGNYKITRLDARTLDSDKNADLGSISVGFDQSNIDGRILRIRKIGSFKEGDAIACEFSDLGDDGVWHLKPKGDSTPSLDLSFSIEPVDETSNKITFRGTVDGSLVGALNDSGSFTPGVAVEGELEPPKLLTANFCVELLCFLCSCCLAMMQGNEGDERGDDAPGGDPSVGDPSTSQQRPIHRVDEEDLEAQNPDERTEDERRRRLKKKKGIAVVIKHRDHKGPDKDDGTGGDQEGKRIVTMRSATRRQVREKRTSGHQGGKQTSSRTKTRGMLSPEFQSSLLNGHFNTLMAYQHLVWMDLVSDMASKASQLLLDTLPQIDPVSGKSREVTHGIDWDSVVKSQVTQVNDTATQPTPVDVLQWRFINGLHASAMSYVHPALSNEFITLDKTRHPLAKELVPFWDVNAAINDSLKIAVKSQPVMEVILDNAWRILAEEQAKQSTHPVPHPTPATALQLQQDIRQAAAKSQSQLLAYVDGLDKAERAGELKLDQSASAVASSLGLAKIKADTFAPQAQPSNWPGVPTWLLLLNAGGVNQRATSKTSSAGGPGINRKSVAAWEKVQMEQYGDVSGVGSVSIRMEKPVPVYVHPQPK